MATRQSSCTRWFLHHVPERAGLVVIAGPAFKSHGFSHRDLHMVDMRRVPQWLIKRIGEAQRHQVLNRFLAQIMVYAEDLPLRQTHRQ
jgi:hypothetical protein